MVMDTVVVFIEIVMIDVVVSLLTMIVLETVVAIKHCSAFSECRGCKLHRIIHFTFNDMCVCECPRRIGLVVGNALGHRYKYTFHNNLQCVYLTFLRVNGE